jgi:hypothetical protein
MHPSRIRFAIVALASLVTALVAFSEPAAAAPVDVSGCVNTVSLGARISQYPAYPGDQSQLQAACVINSKTGDNDADPYLVSSAFTIHDYPNAVWHNGAARTVNGPAANPPSQAFIVVDSCRGMIPPSTTSWVNHIITGPGIPVRTHVTSIAGGPLLCTLNLNKMVDIAGGDQAYKVENSKARWTSDIVSDTGAGDTTLTSAADGNFTTEDNSCSVTGAEVQPGTTATFDNANQITISPGLAPWASAGSGKRIVICGSEEVSTTRTTNGATFPAGGTTITESAGTNGNRFVSTDVGLQVYGVGITDPCVITAVGGTPSGTTATVANANTGAACTNGSAGTKVVTIGDPTPTAPLDGEQLMNIGMQLDLHSTLVPDKDPCTQDTVDGLSFQGAWRNPRLGNFISGPFATQPPNTKAIGQLVIDWSLVDFAAYVIERRAGTAGDPSSAAHYDVVFPNFPFTLALCPSATSPGVSFSIGIPGSSVAVNALPYATGRPDTNQLRRIRPTTDATFTSAHVTSDDGVHVWPTGLGQRFTHLCVILPPPATVDFKCGPG